MNPDELRGKLRFDDRGLITAIAQDHTTGEVLMLAHMNWESLNKTIETKQAVYWSRSRNKLWHKGEESGNVQDVKEILVDCDGDALLLKVEQTGGAACHTGNRSCFSTKVESGRLVNVGVRIFDPEKVYKPKGT